MTNTFESLAATSLGSDAFLLVLYVVLALLFSFLCSVAEATLLSITPSYIAGLKEAQPQKATLLKQLKEDNIDQSLAAILTVNTIAHTVGAIGAGSKATSVFGSAWFGLFSAVMTLLILFLSEIVPKTLGAVYWRQLASPTAAFVNLLVKSMYPLIVVSERITRLISGGKKLHDFNREEFVALAGIGQEQGLINERESKIIRNLFLFKSVEASTIMTPRIVVAALQKDTPVHEALGTPEKTPFSRLPIYGNDLDSVSGFVLREDLLVAQNQGKGEQPVSTFRREIVSVPSSTPLSRLLETLLEQRQHIAVVVGEYGETKGLVTLEDVVETLLGIEILDEGDKVEDMQQLARQLWAKRAERMGLKLDAE
ncbi:hemolysin family protein [Hydrogenophaga sp. PAMC20947]|uniref:CNNM domain-containing protein n=1 Tax=Hydrogenophaga sp. PAMC20947 TaxID=2565558 RepID=UPI00109E2080|nr:hemolysin family protein [Hydrogenophaga sp. PAMC20947]QCB46143.1 HlyC/CorC family transporter [Hydrogenophaga sp. PAMC20947]